jgi:hypothetical protein
LAASLLTLIRKFAMKRREIDWERVPAGAPQVVGIILEAARHCHDYFEREAGRNLPGDEWRSIHRQTLVPLLCNVIACVQDNASEWLSLGSDGRRGPAWAT